MGYYTSVASPLRYSMQIIDRLVHMGGLDGTSVAAQTVSTSALTRSTGGAMAAVESYTGVGATQTTFTVSYTNQAGTAGQTSQPVLFGGAPAGRGTNAGSFVNISLAAGDTAVQAVSTLTLAASTLTVGNFGVTLYKPISPWIPLSQGDATAGDPVLDWGGYAALVDAGACIGFLFKASSAFLYTAGMSIEMFED